MHPASRAPRHHWVSARCVVLREAGTVRLDYGDTPLVIHNAIFDVGFLNAEYALHDHIQRMKGEALLDVQIFVEAYLEPIGGEHCAPPELRPGGQPQPGETVEPA